MELRVKTQFVLGLLKAKLTGLEHGGKKPEGFVTTTLLTPRPPYPSMTAVKESMILPSVLFLSLIFT